MKKQGCWIFISHSSADIEKIRVIRNEFEKYGQNPLAFYLKCLRTDSEVGKTELFDLIKREIEEREWFVYCESSSAQKSPYVKMERDYVRSIGKKMIWTIDLSQPLVDIVNQVQSICCDLQVFVSYSHADQEPALGVIKALENKDYEVWDDRLMQMGEAWINQTEAAIMTIAKKGFFLALITKNRSSYMDEEIEIARSNGATVIVLIFDNAIEKNFAMLKYGTENVFVISNRPSSSEMYQIEEIVSEALYHKLMK